MLREDPQEEWGPNSILDCEWAPRSRAWQWGWKGLAKRGPRVWEPRTMLRQDLHAWWLLPDAASFCCVTGGPSWTAPTPHHRASATHLELHTQKISVG